MQFSFFSGDTPGEAKGSEVLPRRLKRRLAERAQGMEDLFQIILSSPAGERVFGYAAKSDYGHDVPRIGSEILLLTAEEKSAYNANRSSVTFRWGVCEIDARRELDAKV